VLAESSSENVRRLMTAFRLGDKAAAGQLVDLFYPELRRLAQARMRSERAEHSWQPTVLVNELYLELIRVKVLRESDADGDEEREAFLRLSAHLMRRLLIHHARRSARPLEDQGDDVLADLPDGRIPGTDALAEVEGVLGRLEAVDPKLRTLVELRVFEGLTGAETAERMGCGSATVTRYWSFARRWLQDELGASLPVLARARTAQSAS
jgi:RNA polymerase sigma factor (TIGR02999 family)